MIADKLKPLAVIISHRFSGNELNLWKFIASSKSFNHSKDMFVSEEDQLSLATRRAQICLVRTLPLTKNQSLIPHQTLT
jgi:hypothetical protein